MGGRGSCPFSGVALTRVGVADQGHDWNGRRLAPLAVRPPAEHVALQGCGLPLGPSTTQAAPAGVALTALLKRTPEPGALVKHRSAVDNIIANVSKSPPPFPLPQPQHPGAAPGGHPPVRAHILQLPSQQPRLLAQQPLVNLDLLLTWQGAVGVQASCGGVGEGSGRDGTGGSGGGRSGGGVHGGGWCQRRRWWWKGRSQSEPDARARHRPPQQPHPPVPLTWPPPPTRSKCVHMRVSRGNWYSSCASSTCAARWVCVREWGWRARALGARERVGGCAWGASG